MNEIVKLYLSMDTNYALLITGEWGVGKTFYFNNTLKNIISATDVYDDVSKKYTPIHVSLFGLKSIEELQTEILLSLYPLLKNKEVKIVASAAKLLIKGFLQLKNLGKTYEIVSDSHINKGDLINFTQLVICFDDLERKSEKLTLEEFIGFINSLVENGNAKILVIANEQKLEKGNYHDLKEKIVGNTIEFTPNIDITFDSLIKKYQAFSLYSDFLKTNKEYILEVFKRKSSNLRILIFALNYFQNIFSELEKNLIDEVKLKSIQNEIYNEVLRFTLAISIEYKLGTLSFKNRIGLDKQDEINLNNILSSSGWVNNSNQKNEEKSPAQKFHETFYSNDHFRFYQSIYDFVTGGSAFIFKDLLSELKVRYHDTLQDTLPQYSIFNKLSIYGPFYMSNEEYLSNTKMLLHYAYNGEFELANYLHIFFYALRFGNPLNLKADNVTKRLIQGMQKGKEHFKYEPYLGEIVGIPNNHEHLNLITQIREAMLDINKSISIKKEIAQLDEIETLCYKNFKDFKEIILNTQQPYSYNPVFHNFNSDKFFNLFNSSSNGKKLEIKKLLDKRYQWNSNLNFKEELRFFNKLKTRIDKKHATLKGKNVSGTLVSDFRDTLQTVITSLGI